MGSVSAFKSTLQEAARPNRFECSGFGGLANLTFFAKGSVLPSSTIGACDAPYQGRIIKLAGDRIYNDFTMTIYQDNKATIRKQLEDQMKSINDPEGNTGATSMGAYKKEGTVKHLNRSDGAIMTYNLVGCVPIEIGELTLGWDTNDQPAEYTVTFAYDYFTT